MPKLFYISQYFDNKSDKSTKQISLENSVLTEDKVTLTTNDYFLITFCFYRKETSPKKISWLQELNTK